MRTAKLVALTLILLLTLAVVGWAQETPTPADEQDPNSTAGRADAWKRIEMYRLFKLTEALQLDEDAASRLFPILQRYDHQYRTISEKKEELQRTMFLELKKNEPDRTVLTKAVDDTLALERESMRIRTEQFKELKKILTPEQYARFLIFDQRFRDEVGRMINDIHQRRHGAGGRGGRGMGR